LKEIALSRKGTINTFSVVEMRPPGGDYRGDVPYAIGFVSLPEGVRVQTLITGCDPEDITVGMEVEMIIDVLHEDDEGNEIMAYKFRPAAS
jgi:uncharacterized OB-fold protein